MDTIQKQIISLLRSKKKPLPVGYLESQLSANKTRILTAIDELSLNHYIDVTRSSGGTIKRVSLSEAGDEKFIINATKNNATNLQEQINELRNLIESLQKEATQLEISEPDSPSKIEKISKIVSTLNTATTFVKNAMDLINKVV